MQTRADCFSIQKFFLFVTIFWNRRISFCKHYNYLLEKAQYMQDIISECVYSFMMSIYAKFFFSFIILQKIIFSGLVNECHSLPICNFLSFHWLGIADLLSPCSLFKERLFTYTNKKSKIQKELSPSLQISSTFFICREKRIKYKEYLIVFVALDNF